MRPYQTGPGRSADERERLILEHLPQVNLIASRMHERLPGHASLEDLISAGILGLIQAVDNYDRGQQTQLKTYAEHRIRGAILDSLRDLDWAPRSRRRQAREAERAIAELEQRLGRLPEETEIAAHLGLSLADYQQLLSDMQSLTIGRFELAGADGDGYDLLNILPDEEGESPEEWVRRAELEARLAESIAGLPENEQLVLSLYFQEELTLQEIASILGVHLSRVSQIKTQAVLRLRTRLNGCGSAVPSHQSPP